ncbi:MAG: type 1 glutamine amidotransferase [Desulfobacterota bacterium]|nr:type 1 glutamine amidotransferase [Thermodesulfobacteriota bacterium]
MRIHLIEHDSLDFQTNVDHWATQRGHALSRTEVFRGEPFPDPDTYDWLMVMGGSQHAWEEPLHPWLAAEKDGLGRALDRGKVILGICFGAQLLAEALGGQVFPHREREIGWHSVSQTAAGRLSELFRGVPSDFLTFHWHSDHYDLPGGAVPLASSACSENQAFTHPAYPLLGLQFHPEYTREMVGHFAREFSAAWTPGPFVAGPGPILSQTETVPDTYWLMEKILDNMARFYRPENPLPHSIT